MTNLRILDAYLNESNSEQLLKDAIDLSKPFFFANQLSSRLAAASRTLMDAFKAESTSNLLLEYYLFNAWNPEARHSAVVRKIAQYSEERERVNIAEAVMPQESRRYAVKKWLSLMGQEEQMQEKEQLEAVTAKEYANLGALG